MSSLISKTNKRVKREFLNINTACTLMERVGRKKDSDILQVIMQKQPNTLPAHHN